ncbi:acyltransferase domain-containing protein [Streptomyces sp. V3I7]|uniref:acyltransferase domain-containing protein n=1 Tax=Streptomyces sp. V3I7 TaxID=3042278 RepID=UPI002780C866|nr:acyltransferase domain-containing protein [Streptomyces sp. V3I7]MDQ0990290.1 hypothetical protein [Streptomyces sp. V3I7]
MLPDADDLAELLLDLAVPHEDINQLVGLRRRVTGDPGLSRLVAEYSEDLVQYMGEIGRPSRIEDRSAEPPAALGDYFSVYVFVAALPYTRAYHRERGIPDEISRRTLADLGRHIAVYRRRYGRGGVQSPYWLVLHFRGLLYQLGRLQFERARVRRSAARRLAATGMPESAGDPCLALHIPDFHGPLTPAACDLSLARAREFFSRHFPEERRDTAICESWLLDPQLREYLPADSNIVRFQDRFRVGWDGSEPADKEPVQFVFGDADLPPADLPRRTSVQRAVGDHLRAGRHWHIGHGWFPLEPGELRGELGTREVPVGPQHYSDE